MLSIVIEAWRAFEMESPLVLVFHTRCSPSDRSRLRRGAVDLMRRLSIMQALNA